MITCHDTPPFKSHHHPNSRIARHKASLFEAIRILFEVGSALEADEKHNLQIKESVLAAFERMGVKIPDRSN